MSRLKYVIVEATVHGYRQQLPVVFGEAMVHRTMAHGAIRSLNDEHGRLCQPAIISAGFYSFSRGEAYGRSESLDIESRGEADAEVIKQGRVFVTVLDSAQPLVDAEQRAIEPASLDTEPVREYNYSKNKYATATKGSALRDRFKGRR